MDVKGRLKLSVIIPAFNAEKYIGKCLESVSSSKYNEMEIIVVNDGSIDKTETIVREFIKKNNKIKLIGQENGGLSSARNKGMSYASGDYILFLDSDDWLDKKYIEKCMSLLNETRSDVLLTGYIKEYKKRSEVIDLFNEDRKTFSNKEVKEQLLLRLIGPMDNFNPLKLEVYNTAWGKFYKKNILEKIKFSPREEVGLAEDLWFNVQFFCKASSADYYGIEKIHYNRTNGNSLVSSYNVNNIEQMRRLHQCLLKKISQEKLDDIFLKALDNRIVLSVFSELIHAMRNPLGTKYVLEEIRNVLNSPLYSKSKRKIDYSKFENIWWRMFFILGKNKKTILLFFLMKIALLIQRRIRG